LAAATLHVCVSCCALAESGPERARPGRRLLQQLEAIADLPLRVEAIECLAVCDRPVTVAFSGPGRWTYLFGDLSPEQGLDDLIAYARAYGTSANGIVPLRDRPASVRAGTIARVPPHGFTLRKAAE